MGTPTSSDSSFCEEDDWEGMSPGGGFGYRLECNSMARAYRKHFLGRVSLRDPSTSVSVSVSVSISVSVPRARIMRAGG